VGKEEFYARFDVLTAMNTTIALFRAADTLKTDKKSFFFRNVVSLYDYTIPKTLSFRMIVFTCKCKDP